jgi:hypothetical protein
MCGVDSAEEKRGWKLGKLRDNPWTGENQNSNSGVKPILLGGGKRWIYS